MNFKSAICTTIAIVLLTAGALAAGKYEQTIRSLDKEWSQAAQNKDAAKCASFYSDDASIMPFNAPIATGMSQIKDEWSQLMAKPGFALHFEPNKIELSKSRDMAYDMGTFELKLNDAQGSPMTMLGKYVVVWKKTTAGWKVQADIFNTDK